MDLRKGTITIGELAQNPKAIALLNQYGTDLIHHPFAFIIKGWTVNQAVDFARKRGVPEEQIQSVIRQVEAL